MTVMISAALTFLLVMDPLGNVPLFLTSLRNTKVERRQWVILRECLIDPGITEVLAVGRSPTGVQHAKLREVLHDDFTDFSKIESQLAGFDACFFCLGISSVGLSEADYSRITYDMPVAAGQARVQAPGPRRHRRSR